MSFLAKLKIDGEEYNLLNSSFQFQQNLDHNNKPSGAPRGGTINIVIESQGKTNFFSWMIDHKQAKDGTITFYKRDAMSRLYHLKFTKAFCVHYKEEFDAHDAQPLKIEMTITAKKIEIEGKTFENQWVIQ